MRSAVLLLGTAPVTGLTSASQEPAVAPAPAAGPPTEGTGGSGARGRGEPEAFDSQC